MPGFLSDPFSEYRFWSHSSMSQNDIWGTFSFILYKQFIQCIFIKHLFFEKKKYPFFSEFFCRILEISLWSFQNQTLVNVLGSR